MANKRYQVPAEEIRRTIQVENSQFIASLAPAFSVEEARAFIQRIRGEFSDATHNVPAFLIGGGESVTAHSSDDGEPSGTAGRPALAVLQGSGLGDVALVVTRYFGGIKLGTGGLVRAYTEAAQAVTGAVQRAVRIPTDTLMLDLPYRFLERVRLLAAAEGGEVLDEEFGATITLTARFPVEKTASFQHALSEASNGVLRAEVVERKEVMVRVGD